MTFRGGPALATGVGRRQLIAWCGACLAGRQAVAASSDDFRQFADDLWPDAQASGISRRTFDDAFAGLTPDPKVVAIGERQSEFDQPIGIYVERAVSAGRLARGRTLAARHADRLRAIEGRYGVPGSMVLALWAMESEYGASTGGFDVIRSLATLASRGSRRNLFRRELLAALRILEDGQASRATLTGSWAGAMGQTQFTPTSFLAFAVDGDGDGRRDIWRSEPDAMASIANFLARNGWQRGLPWGFEVRLPDGLDIATYRRSLPEWSALGATHAGGGKFPASGEASLFLPAGIRGPAFLLTDNFEAIRAYNTSDSYALAAGRLSDRLAGGGPLARAWPQEPVLVAVDRREVHRRLAALGLYAGVPDGKFGAQTRNAVRRFQVSRGIVPDGYADGAVLKALRAGP